MKVYSVLLGVIAIVPYGPIFGQGLAPDATLDASLKARGAAAYDTVIPMITEAERQAGYVGNGNGLFDLGISAFLASPEDERAERVLTYLGLLPEMMSDGDRKIYEMKYADRIGELLARTALPENVREGVLYMGIWHEAAFLYLNPALSEADLVPFRAKINALKSMHLESKWVASDSKWLEVLYGDLLTKADPLAAKNFWGNLASNGDPEVMAIARGKINFLELKLRRTPMDLVFTAADGRRVDSKEMRGKVVLIDFWATWCPFCIAELPSIKKAYDAYHEQGFEVIGISCEFAGLDPSDSDAVRDRKVNAAKMKLMRFAQRWTLPWPQYFDGMGLSSNKVASRFGVDSLPAMFLLDRDGRLVEANDPGIKFEVDPLVNQLLAARTHIENAGQ